MNPEYHKELETEIDRALKALPDLPAPPSLAARVMRAVEQRAQAPWYRQSWQNWPAPLRAVSFALLLAFSAGLYFALWKLPASDTYAAALHQVGDWVAGFKAVGQVLQVLLGAVGLVLRRLGPAVWLGGLAAAALGYALCVGLGTVYVRLALAQVGAGTARPRVFPFEPGAGTARPRVFPFEPGAGTARPCAFPFEPKPGTSRPRP